MTHDLAPMPTPSDDGQADQGAEHVGEYRYNVHGLIGGRYVVHDRAAGGWGQVYLCYDREHDYFYALKTLKLSQRLLEDPQTHSRLEREVNTWISLGAHPHIVQCFSLETFDSLPFIILEWVADSDLLSRLYREQHQNQPIFLDWYARLGEQGLDLRKHQNKRNLESAGTSLFHWIYRYKHLSLQHTLQITQDICAGLIHAQMIYPAFTHGDIKSGNVLLTEQLRAKVTDFGTAQIEKELLAPGRLSGTASYRAPEQWRGEPIDSRTDIYALGCLLYEMLMGRTPFESALDNEALLRHQHEKIRPPALPPDFSSALNELVQTCLAKEPSSRFANLNQMMESIASLLDKRPNTQAVSAKPRTVEELNQAAVAYYNLEQFDEALAELDRAVEIDSSYPNSYTNRGCIYHVRGETQRALEDYFQAIRLGREAINAKVRNNRGLLYLAMNHPKKGLSDLLRAIKQEPDYANAQCNLGLVYAALGETVPALDAYNQALVLNATHVIAQHNRGYLHEQIGNTDAAIDDYKAALSHAPAFLQARFNLYALYSNLGRVADAQHERQQLERLHPTLRWEQERKSSFQWSRPDPQLLNTGSLARVIEQPFLDLGVKRLAEAEAIGLLPKPPERMPVHAMGRVTHVEYSDWLHESVLAAQADGQRVTQVTIHIQLYEGIVHEDNQAGIRECCLRLDETAMRQLGAVGLRTIYDVMGRILVVHNDHPHDLTHPLRIWAVH